MYTYYPRVVLRPAAFFSTDTDSHVGNGTKRNETQKRVPKVIIFTCSNNINATLCRKYGCMSLSIPFGSCQISENSYTHAISTTESSSCVSTPISYACFDNKTPPHYDSLVRTHPFLAWPLSLYHQLECSFVRGPSSLGVSNTALLSKRGILCFTFFFFSILSSCFQVGPVERPEVVVLCCP